MQLPSCWEKDTFYPRPNCGIQARAVHIWCISLCSFNCTFWGDIPSIFLNPSPEFPFLSLCWVLLLSRKICCTKFQVLREEEFAPVKNANGSNFDTPDSARLLVLRLHTRWVIAAGGFLTHSVPLYATGNFIIYFMCIHMWSSIIQEYFSKIWNGKGGREDA